MFPEPVVERVLALYDLVRAVGWDGARELSSETFDEWEADFVAEALGILASETRGQDHLEQLRLWALMLGRR